MGRNSTPLAEGQGRLGIEWRSGSALPSAGALSFAACLCLAVPVQAQDAPAAQEDEEVPAEAAEASEGSGSAIVVTGSRISAPGFVSPTPITAFSEEQLEMTGAQTAQHLQQEIPVLIPNQANQMVSTPPGS